MEWVDPSGHSEAMSILSPESLRAYLEAQCTDEQCAAKFGFADMENERIDVAGFIDAVKSDEALKIVYITGRKSGEAILKQAQWNDGMKNSSERIWLGKQHLGQSDKVDGAECCIDVWDDEIDGG